VAGIAGTGPLRSLLDVMDRAVPVIGKGIEVLHTNPCLLEGIPDGRNDAQRRYLFSVAGVFPKDETWFGFGAGPFMTIVAIPILAAGMATEATHLAPVNVVGCLREKLLRLDLLVAVRAGGSVFYCLLREIHPAITMEFPFLVAVKAHHSLLVMDIRRPAVFAGVLRIDTSTVAESAGFAFVLPDEFMALDEAAADSGNRRRFYMTSAAGRVAAPAGFFEDMLVEGF